MSNEQQFENEVTFRDIILQVQEYFRYLLRQWKWIVLAILLGIIAGGLVNYLTPVRYVAQSTFMVEEDEGSGSGIGSALSAFGLGGGSKGGYNYAKVIKLAQSRNVIMAALLDTMYQSDVLICNEIIREYDMQEAVEDRLGKDLLPRSTSYVKMSPQERSVMNQLYGRITRSDGPGYVISHDESSKMITARVTSTDEILSYSLAQSLYHHLNRFYIFQATNKYEDNLASLETRLDSVRTVLQSKEYQLAQERDRSRGVLQSRDRLTEGRLMRDVEITNRTYGEVIKNYETARYMLATLKPVFTVVDDIYFPLQRQRQPLLRNMVLYALVLTVLTAFILILRKVYRDVMG